MTPHRSPVGGPAPLGRVTVGWVLRLRDNPFMYWSPGSLPSYSVLDFAERYRSKVAASGARSRLGVEWGSGLEVVRLYRRIRTAKEPA